MVWKLTLVLASFVALIPQTAWSGEWTSELLTSLTTSFEDNPTLDANNETANGQFLTNPTLTNRYEEERYRIEIESNATLVRSTEQSVEANHIRYGFDIDGEYDLQSGSVGATVSFGQDSVQNTEFEDTGVLGNASDVTRTDSSLGLRYDHDFDDQWGLKVTETYDKTSFSGGDFTNSTNNKFLISIDHTYSDFLTLTPSIGYDRFEPADAKPSNTYRLNMGGDYDLSDASNVGLTIGALQTDGLAGWSLKADYNREFEDFSLATDASRDVIPSSSGVLRESTGLGFKLIYHYTDFTEAGFDASWRSSTENGAADSGDTVQVELGPWVSWVLNEEWDTRLSFRERLQQQSGTGTVRSSSISIVFNYKLPL